MEGMTTDGKLLAQDDIDALLGEAGIEGDYDEETKVTVSIGVSAFPDGMKYSIDMFDKELMLELLKRADQALYKAKEEGRNRVVLYE